MVQQSLPNDDQPGPAELTLDEEIAQMVGASDAATAEALAQDGFVLPPDPLEGEPAPVEPSESAPAPEPAAPEPTPAAVAESEQVALLKAENVRLVRAQEEQAERSAQQALELQAEQGKQRYVAELIAQGWDENKADVQAESEKKRYLSEQSDTRHSDALYKSNLAQELNLSHNVPVATLMAAKTETEMRSLAVAQIKTPREVALEAENVALKKAQIPVQPYSSTSNRVAASSEARELENYNRGSRTPAAEAAGARAASGF